MKKVLLIAEAVTLAHVARPLCFARALDRSRYDLSFACADSAAHHPIAAGLPQVALRSISGETFLRRLARGLPLYDAETLDEYVADDLALIERARPDLVVGDFRLSLSISCRLARIPYAAITSAYWSPYYRGAHWTVPNLPLTRVMPIGLAQRLFDVFRPIAFSLHCRPLNEVRRRHGLKPLPTDLRHVYTDADFTLYSDLPQMFPLATPPASHRFLGPALWEPDLKAPAWLDQLPMDAPIVYVTLGSSGDPRLLSRVVRALAALPGTIIAATAGQPIPFDLPPNVHADRYLPGLQAARRARLVVCNGGSLTAYQALDAGAAVIGIAGNLDQFLNMQAFERAGLGCTLRADRLKIGELQKRAVAMLAGADSLASATRESSAYNFEQNAQRFVAETIG